MPRCCSPSGNSGTCTAPSRRSAPSWNACRPRATRRCKPPWRPRRTRRANSRATVASLREELQTLQGSKEESVQAAVAAGHDDARQLQGTVQKLRDEMERLRHEHAEQTDKQMRASQDEIRQLRGTIASLREQLEKPHAR